MKGKRGAVLILSVTDPKRTLGRLFPGRRQGVPGHWEEGFLVLSVNPVAALGIRKLKFLRIDPIASPIASQLLPPIASSL